MNKGIEDLINMYGDNINLNFKSPVEVVRYVSKMYDLNLIIKIEQMPTHIIDVFISNLSNHYSKILQNGELMTDLRYVRIINNNKSKKLYSGSHDDIDDRRIILVIDNYSGYFYTNSPYLNYKLVEFIGVTQEDVDSVSIRYLNYLIQREQFKIHLNC